MNIIIHSSSKMIHDLPFFPYKSKRIKIDTIEYYTVFNVLSVLAYIQTCLIPHDQLIRNTSPKCKSLTSHTHTYNKDISKNTFIYSICIICSTLRRQENLLLIVLVGLGIDDLKVGLRIFVRSAY